MPERWTFQAARKEAEKRSPYFVLLRSAGDLLMLPKDMLTDKSVRKEVPHPLPVLLWSSSSSALMFLSSANITSHLTLKDEHACSRGLVSTVIRIDGKNQID